MVRKRGAGNLELILNLADHEPFGVGGEQQLHNAQPRLDAHGGKHVGVTGDAVAVRSGLAGSASHISIILEIWTTNQTPVESRLTAAPRCTGQEHSRAGARR